MYSESSPEQSAEMLRLVVPLMGRLGLAPSPVNYAVLYEYVTGSNADLKQTLDDLAGKGGLSERAMEDLYLQHVSLCDFDTLRQVESRVGEVLEDVSTTVREAGDQAGFLDRSLRQAEGELSVDRDLADLRTTVASLARDTHSVQEANHKLQAQLEATMQEVDELRAELERTRQEAVIDPLTGLVNRKGFSEALEEALVRDEEPDRSPVSLLMVDIDHFKRVNDTYGHLLGDKVIRIVAKTIKENIKGKDTAFRYGGEEFAVLLPETDRDGARSLAERIRGAIARGRIRRVDTGGYIDKVTISVGVATHKEREAELDFVQRADEALYRSKRAGRNRVSVDLG